MIDERGRHREPAPNVAIRVIGRCTPSGRGSGGGLILAVSRVPEVEFADSVLVAAVTDLNGRRATLRGCAEAAADAARDATPAAGAFADRSGGRLTVDDHPDLAPAMAAFHLPVRGRGLARTRTRIWSGPGSGTGRSATRSTSGGPCSSKTTARIVRPAVLPARESVTEPG